MPYILININLAKPAPPKVPDHLEVRLQSYPALGEVAVLRGGDVPFLAVLEIPKFRADESWESGKEPQTIHAKPPHLTRFYFDASFSISTSFRFSFLFRSGRNEAWRSIRDKQGLEDGQIIIGSTNPSNIDHLLGGIIPDLNPACDRPIDTNIDQTLNVRSWMLRATISGADGESAAFDSFDIGTAWGSFLKWFALVRLSPYWIAPRQGKSQFTLDKDAILCSFLGPQGNHLVFLAVNGWNEVLSGFRSAPDGAITVHARNDGSSQSTLAVVIAAGDDFEAVVATAVRYARSFVAQVNNDWDSVAAPLADTSRHQDMEDWYDGLGYCTWNAIGQDVTGEKILSALSKLEKSNINITNLIIDDGWQSTDNGEKGQFQRGMVAFQANRDGFPSGLKPTVSLIREKHPNIRHIAVWHALLGYWGGISPNGEFASKYKTVEVVREDADPRNLPEGGRMTVVAKEDILRFYDNFYQFLSDAGIDAVKTDAQGIVDTWISPSVRAELTPSYLDAWTICSHRHFGIRAVSCISQTPQALFRCYLRKDQSRTVVQNSDNFFPEINAHNSILTQHLNILPDWDMFQTVNQYAGFHAAARCISGGTIYITDIPGKHDTDLVREMTGSTPDGKTVVLRLSSIGKSVQPYSRYKDDLLLKLGAYYGPLRSPVLAIFNISTRPLTELLPFSSFPNIESTKSYVVRAHSTGTVSVPTETEGSSSSAIFTSSLNVRGYDIFTAYPLQMFTVGTCGQIGISNMGLLGKMTGCAGVISSSIERYPNQRILLTTELKALGTLGVYITLLPGLVIGDSLSVSLFGHCVDTFTRVSTTNTCMLEVNLELAWRRVSTICQKNASVQVLVSIQCQPVKLSLASTQDVLSTTYNLE
ncbi:glycoside hydrolase family 36 protein [Fusarium redolens]|uniref:Glycoside hydrolase family 36 protein n=1 Tax=Fusarium redolens TaxID=48865 RepID=A0A9P9GTR5_FUSRE|nr:glycoside hydrolase family 36 protein [Fusarium redolens]KAH7244535.1 glycoside hydrolase family 36 protein [Fusarium redolens]